MSDTIRARGTLNLHDGDIECVTKDKNPRKSFLLDSSEKPYTKAAGGPGNKRGWKVFIPKWLRQQYKENQSL